MLKTYGLWEVPLRMTDSRGTVKEFTIVCHGINRDPRDKGSPVLLNRNTLNQQRIVLVPYKDEWWFKQQWNEAIFLSPREFDRESAEVGKIYAILAAPEDYYLPEPDSGAQPQLTDAELQLRLPSKLHEHLSVFRTERSGILPQHKSTDHAIDLLEGESPPYGPIYPLSPAELKELREYIDENLKKGRIRHSKSSAGSPILFVPKKNGKLRLCVDYRGLNKVTEKNRYALPLVTEIMDRVTGSTYFSKIDVKDAYYRIRIKEGDEWKTAFRTRYGHFEYLVMPFGLTNAPATFQHYIHQAMGGLVNTTCIIYLDDVLVFSRDKESHTVHLRQVLNRLEKAGLYANIEKCEFYRDEVHFLGFVISKRGVSMDPERVAMIRDWKEPTTYHEVQVFLGFCNFYRRFIYNYSSITRPLHNLTKGSVNGKKPGSVILTRQEQAAFHTLIQSFQEAPLLRHFNPERPVRIETDASRFAMAGILSQPGDKGLWHPVAFWSRGFRGAELNYGTPDQEIMAIVESFKH